jgi:hypothetical protein
MMEQTILTVPLIVITLLLYVVIKNKRREEKDPVRIPVRISSRRSVRSKDR